VSMQEVFRVGIPSAFFGLIGGFFLKGITVQYRCPWSSEIAGRLQMILAEIGYHPESAVGNTMTFKPSFMTAIGHKRRRPRM